MSQSLDEDAAAPEDQDSLLVDRFICGDQDAFSALVRRYKDKVYQFILWYTDNGREAEDISQEVFIEVFKSLKSFRRQSAFNTWLYALARNVCRYHARKNDKARTVQEPEELLEIPDSSCHEMDLEKAESGQLVRAAVESLPLFYREILLLREWERMPYESIATVLQIPVGTVRSRLHNGMVLLAKKLSEAIGPDKGK